MLSMAGEKLFNIERAYKGICLQKVAAVEKMRIVTDFELFRTCASSGHNPRRFVAFNDEHLKKLENSDDRRRLAEKFGLPLLEENSTQHKTVFLKSLLNCYVIKVWLTHLMIFRWKCPVLESGSE